ncbi:MAG: DNA mismatch repair endonuclease MutL [Candidatus Bipolaricaulota bacterium]|nr:DNA mismatch repair endonuclease MutL [Candidatus Bipolaricaulota bacterium]
MRIRRLDEGVIRKIAAGEVVDRPASALKELVENSLDAGARRIAVEVAEGGIARLVVADDGHGMTPEELRLAVERHTTSKLQTEEDLRHIRTLGFRGEALAAICAVARVTLVSRAAGAEEGHEVRVEGGRLVVDRPAAHPVGTTVVVEDLFWNVPARRQFLDSPGAEARRTLGVLRRIVLARPETAFTVRSEGREVLTVPPAPSPLFRIRQVYGAEFAEELLPVELRDPGFHLRAWFGPPELARPTRVDQHLFLSGRPVRPGTLGVGIAQVYARYLPRGSHPAYFLYLDVDPELVDVNVHPRKEEVRFRSEEAAMDLLRRAAMRALGGTPSTPVPSAAGAWASPQAAAPAEEAALFAAPSAGGRPEPWRVVGQVGGAYIVLEEEGGLTVLDQHAAHERVLFERHRPEAGVPSQELLVPVQITVPFDRAAALRRALPELRTLGVVLEPFGEGTFLLRAWPAALADRQSRLGFQEPIAAVAERLLDGEPPLVELWREVACAAAVRAGEVLPPAEQEALVRQWKATREPARCPHGRPVAVHLPWDELARKLGR